MCFEFLIWYALFKLTSIWKFLNSPWTSQKQRSMSHIPFWDANLCYLKILRGFFLSADGQRYRILVGCRPHRLPCSLSPFLGQTWNVVRINSEVEIDVRVLLAPLVCSVLHGKRQSEKIFQKLISLAQQ